MSTSQNMIECDVMKSHATLIGFLSILVSKRSFIRNLSFGALRIKFCNVIHSCEDNIMTL